MQANWNAALEPDRVGENRLRGVNYETTAGGNPLRYALQGFCPVELCDRNRWVPGRAEFQVIYEGQLFQFSTNAALNRFKMSPQKYAPVQGGADIVVARNENRSLAGSVNHSAVWRGRLYLFSSSASLAAFQANPAHYATAATAPAKLQMPDESL